MGKIMRGAGIWRVLAGVGLSLTMIILNVVMIRDAELARIRDEIKGMSNRVSKNRITDDLKEGIANANLAHLHPGGSSCRNHSDYSILGYGRIAQD